MEIKQIGKQLFNLFLLALLPIFAQANQIEQHSLYSKQLEQERKYWVQLPESYSASPNRKYPVFYLLDGQSDMALVSGMLNRLQFSNAAAEMIVVGIDNPDRTWELAPIVNHDPRGPVGKGGGADKFLAFVEKELLPHIDKQYQTHDYRVISGHSIGGLFVLHALQTKPDLFQAYFAISPAVWWSKRTTAANLKTFMRETKKLNKYLYINIGNEGGEMRQVYNELVQFLQQNQPAGLRLETDAFAQASHGLTSAAGMFNAIHQMFLPLRMPTSALTHGAASIKDYFKRVSDQYGKKMQPQEWVVNSLGFDMLDQKRYSEAVDVFEYNRQLYPESPYTHGSLAKAYALNQQKDKALELIEQAMSMVDKDSDVYQVYNKRKNSIVQGTEIQ